MNTTIGHHARKLLLTITWLCRIQELKSVTLSDREAAHRCNFPEKYLSVAKEQLVFIKALSVVEGKAKATYTLLLPTP